MDNKYISFLYTTTFPNISFLNFGSVKNEAIGKTYFNTMSYTSKEFMDDHFGMWIKSPITAMNLITEDERLEIKQTFSLAKKEYGEAFERLAKE